MPQLSPGGALDTDPPIAGLVCCRPESHSHHRRVNTPFSFERSTTARRTIAPSSLAGTLLRLPSKAPIAVHTGLHRTIFTLVHAFAPIPCHQARARGTVGGCRRGRGDPPARDGVG